MQALTYQGATEVVVKDVDNPKIEQATDAVVHVTSAAICGSDLHMYDGRTAVEAGKILGHENRRHLDEREDGMIKVILHP